MEKLGVIDKLSQSTDWVNSLAFSRKQNGKFRVSLDPKDLNEVIKRTYHKTPLSKEISPKFTGAKYFSKMDAQYGYRGIDLDKESSLMTTFSSPFGRYKFLRLLFGLKVRQDIFQQKMNQILEECQGALGISDDVSVYGKTEEEHDENLRTLMEDSRRKRLAFSRDQCHMKKEKINFHGLVWDSKGAHPDPKKCANISRKPSPKKRDRTTTIPRH